MTDYSTEAQAVADAMNAVYENKQTNKKNSISGDFSSDNESYPTVKAVKNQFGTKVTSWSSTTSDTNYPSEKLVKDSLDGKAASNHTHTGTYADSTHTHSATEVTDGNANLYTNIGSLSSGATQQSINSAINSKIGTLGNIELVTVVANLPTASSSTMNKLYLVAETSSRTNDNYEVYITVRTGTSPNYSYDWEKVDTARIDLSGYSTTSHTHGNITSDGKVGTTSGKPLITGSNGIVQAGNFGTSSGQFAEGNHTHSTYTTTSDVQSEISAFASALAEAINPSS